MPCRCTNCSGPCTSDADCHPARRCCGGNCRDPNSVSGWRLEGPYSLDGLTLYSTCFEEGETVLFKVSGCGSPGSEYRWQIFHFGNTVNADFVATSGTGTLDSNWKATFTIQAVVDATESSEQFGILIQAKDASGNWVNAHVSYATICASVTGACCDPITYACQDNKTQGECVASGWTWYPNVTCASLPCNPVCPGGQTTRTFSQSGLTNSGCVVRPYGETTVSIPAGCSWVNISGTVDDVLLVDGYVRGTGTAADGTYQLNTISPCVTSGSVNYTFSKTGSFILAAGDTVGGTASYNVTIKFSDVNSFGATDPVIVMAAGGPGTELKALLAKIGITSTPDCSCNKRAQEMDAKGIQWCKENEELILSWLKEEAEKRGLPFVSVAAKMLIRRAIRNAEKKATNK